MGGEFRFDKWEFRSFADFGDLSNIILLIQKCSPRPFISQVMNYAIRLIFNDTRY